jgi:hypothetical protein
MTRLPVAALLLELLLRQSFAQSGAVIPQGGAGHAGGASCVILKRMGPADQVTSRLYSFGIRGKQFQYVEGKLPEGFPFHGRMTDHDVRNLQGRGAEIIVLNQNFTSDELMQARADCRGETGKTPNQAEAKPAPASTTATVPTNCSCGRAIVTRFGPSFRSPTPSLILARWRRNRNRRRVCRRYAIDRRGFGGTAHHLREEEWIQTLGAEDYRLQRSSESKCRVGARAEMRA